MMSSLAGSKPSTRPEGPTSTSGSGTSPLPFQLNIYDLTEEELGSVLEKDLQQPKYRSKQIRKCEWQKGVLEEGVVVYP